MPIPTGLLYLDSAFIQLMLPFPLNRKPKSLNEKATGSPTLVGSLVDKKSPPSETFRISLFRELFTCVQSHGIVMS
jgi:hypothetical protein